MTLRSDSIVHMAFASVLAIGPSVALASSTDGPQQHRGFYLRMHLGFGAVNMSPDEGDVDLGGTGGTFGIAIGGAVSENVIIFGELFDDVVVQPTLTVDGVEYTSDEDVSAGIFGIGPGIAYWVMPLNLYVSGTLGIAQIEVKQGDDTIGETEFGLGLSAMVGKEWWVSDNWGIGAAAQLFVGSMDDKSDGAKWSAAAFMIALSATYN